MSDTAAAAPAAAETPASNAAPTTPAAASAPAEPSYLADRLERERRNTLKALGIKPPKGVSAAQVIAEERAKAETKKEKRAAEKAALADAQAKVAQLTMQTEALKQYATIELQSLDPKLQEHVKTLAGDDPAEQLRQIANLRTLGAVKAADAPKTADAKPAGTAAQAPPPAAANTAQPPAPAPGSAAETQGIERYRAAREEALNARGAGNRTPMSGEKAAQFLFSVLENEAEILANYNRR